MTQIGVVITPVCDDRSRDSFRNNKEEELIFLALCLLVASLVYSSSLNMEV